MKKLLNVFLGKVFPVTAALCLFSSCSDKCPVSFHMEASEGEPSKMVFEYPVDGKMVKFQRAGFIGSRDIESYRLIRSMDGPVGVGFYLSPGAANRYKALFHDSYGKRVLPALNQQPKGIFKIGGTLRPIMPIYEGLTEDDIKLIRKHYEPHDKEKEYEADRKARTATKIEKLS